LFSFSFVRVAGSTNVADVLLLLTNNCFH
jgi:hypothetical protein